MGKSSEQIMIDNKEISGNFLPKNDPRIADASRELAKSSKEELTVQLDDGSSLALPKMVKALLLNILTELSEGNMVNIVPIHAELTTQEAANYLNVSRPFLVKLLQSGKLPFHKIGSHRRIKYEDLIAFMKEQEISRNKAMQELADQAQELGMGY